MNADVVFELRPVYFVNIRMSNDRLGDVLSIGNL